MVHSDPPFDADKWKKRADFYAGVGQAISIWASMESKLIEIASHLIGTTNAKAGLILYSMNFYGWLTLIDELFLLEPKFSQFKESWGDISDKLRGLNDTRVRLAHHTVWDHPDSLDTDKMALRPGPYDSRSKSKKHAPLVDAEIATFVEKVLNLDKELGNMSIDMWRLAISKRDVPFPGTLFEQEPDQPDGEGAQ